MALLTKTGTRRAPKTGAKPKKGVELQIRTKLNRTVLGGRWIMQNGKRIFIRQHKAKPKFRKTSY